MDKKILQILNAIEIQKITLKSYAKEIKNPEIRKNFEKLISEEYIELYVKKLQK